MRVLIACSRSGVERDAFAARGFAAWEADVLDPEQPAQLNHIKGDVMDLLYRPDGSPTAWSEDFDLMVAHPPCTFLANSGARWLYGGKGDVVDPVRWAAMERAALFFRRLLEHPIRHIAVENPIMHRHGQAIIGRRPDQTVQPWMFGHGETKATSYWLKNLPLLEPTDVVEGRVARVHLASPGPNRWMERSRGLPGMAAAIADQWGGYVQRELLDREMRKAKVDVLRYELEAEFGLDGRADR